MTLSGLYDVEAASREIHHVVLELAESLDDEQIGWRPPNHATSIGFHLWHLARESDTLRRTISERVTQLGPDFGPPTEIWERQSLADAWDFPEEARTNVGTGLPDEVAAALPIPAKDVLLGYLRQSYRDLEQFLALLEERYPVDAIVDPALTPRLVRIREAVLNFLTHDCRHLGMMEVLKGLQTGFGSATETREG